MKQLLDFIPLIIFFILFKVFDIYVATAALIIVTALQLLITYGLYKKVEKMQLITLALMTIFGGMTLLLHDENFIKWKVTIIYLVFAISLMVSHWLDKPIMKSMLGKDIRLPDSIWAKITWMWVTFFILCAGLNTYIAFHLSLETWVNFKVFGLLIATFSYTLLTGVYIYKHLPQEQIDPEQND